MSRKNLLFSLLTAAALVATGTVRAADKPKPDDKPKTDAPVKKDAPKRDTYPFGGKIGKVDAAAKSFTLATKTNRTLLTSETTTYTKGAGQPATFADLKEGEAVGGTAKKNKDGKEEAVAVHIGPKADAGKGKPEPKKTDDKK